MEYSIVIVIVSWSLFPAQSITEYLGYTEGHINKPSADLNGKPCILVFGILDAHV